MSISISSKKIKILTMDAFPKGYATTNRIMTYARGLSELGCKVEVCCIKPTENRDNIFNAEIEGAIYGASFKYYSGQTIKSESYLKRQLQNIKGVFKFFKSFLLEKEKTDCVILYATSPVIGIFLYLVTKYKNCLYLKEENELPLVHTRHQNKISTFFFERYHYYKADGLLLMTNKLVQIFENNPKFKVPILHSPMTVDINRFNGGNKIKINSNNKKYIGYCGSLNNKKDGLEHLLKSFIKLSDKFLDLNLMIAGDIESKEDYPDYQSYLRIVSECNLHNRIFFLGRVDSDLIPAFLMNAHLLVLARPNSSQAHVGFPSKLGEYLCSNKPVIVTNVGEISHYLEDGKNAFLIEPDDEIALSNKIEQVLNNYENALLVAEKGKEVVLKNFNYKIQANNIDHFINKLSNN